MRRSWRDVLGGAARVLDLALRPRGRRRGIARRRRVWGFSEAARGRRAAASHDGMLGGHGAEPDARVLASRAVDLSRRAEHDARVGRADAYGLGTLRGRRLLLGRNAADPDAAHAARRRVLWRHGGLLPSRHRRRAPYARSGLLLKDRGATGRVRRRDAYRLRLREHSRRRHAGDERRRNGRQRDAGATPTPCGRASQGARTRRHRSRYPETNGAVHQGRSAGPDATAALRAGRPPMHRIWQVRCKLLSPIYLPRRDAGAPWPRPTTCSLTRVPRHLTPGVPTSSGPRPARRVAPPSISGKPVPRRAAPRSDRPWTG